MTTSQAGGSVPRPDNAPEPSDTPDTIVPTKVADRIGSLDFIRGIAVMGILAANIIAFGQPFSAYIFPEAFLVPNGDPGGWQWIAQFVAVDGKMRGLFTLLFGAGMYLFMERAWARGSGRGLQMWRLLMLLLFGMVHFYLIWIGDILIMYSLLGFFAVACMKWTARMQLTVGLVGYAFGALLFAVFWTFLHLLADTPFAQGPEFGGAQGEMAAGVTEAFATEAVTNELKQSGDYLRLIQERVSENGSLPFVNAAMFSLETLPLMLIGMALYRLGFFSGGMARAQMVRWGWIGLTVGATVSLGLGLYVKSTGFAYFAGTAAFLGWSQLPRLAMVLGMAALLVAYSPGWTGWLAERVRAAGRAAFTNYLGTSILMLFVMHGWALGLFGELNRPQLYGVTAIFWIVMLAWSKPWLERYRYGPLEWLWRCMTYRKLFALRR